MLPIPLAELRRDTKANTCPSLVVADQELAESGPLKQLVSNALQEGLFLPCRSMSPCNRLMSHVVSNNLLLDDLSIVADHGRVEMFQLRVLCNAACDARSQSKISQ